ncbi:MAG: alpha/beta hydrolase [Kiritimatiellae bacterium]|nr:alpha/beta hydrolase [Kiritimatiellia bacterium]
MQPLLHIRPKGATCFKEKAACPPDDLNVTPKTYRYQSSVDDTKPLLVDVCFKPSSGKLPLIVVMHGYNGGRAVVRPDIVRLAGKGLFAIAPDMRGRGGSGGQWDSGGLDVMDIHDAVQFCLRKFVERIDASNLNVIGYSGGGGNAFACFVRFPDLFRVAASFFGIPDYATFNRLKGRPDCNRVMVAALGGPPGRIPAVYAARNATLAAGNNGQTRFHIFWDEAENDCPGSMDEDFIRASRAAGHRNCLAHRSRVRDRARWRHGYTANWPELIEAEDIFVPEILQRRVPKPILPPSGTLVVPGYLVTRHFAIWVHPAGQPERAGQSGVAEVLYRHDGSRTEFTVLSVTGGHQVKIVAATAGA